MLPAGLFVAVMRKLTYSAHCQEGTITSVMTEKSTGHLGSEQMALLDGDAFSEVTEGQVKQKEGKNATQDLRGSLL